MRSLLVVVATFAIGGTATAGGFVAIPPLEIDLGARAPVGAARQTAGTSTELLVGVHWASLAWMPTRLDFGVGYVGSFRAIDRAALGEVAEDMPKLDEQLRIHGGYLTLGTTLAAHRHWRTWIAARGELLRASGGGRDFSALGGSLRIATELFGAGAASGRNAIIVGTLAIGLYAEVTYRDVPAELGRLGLSSGLTFRLPLLVGG